MNVQDASPHTRDDVFSDTISVSGSLAPLQERLDMGTTVSAPDPLFTRPMCHPAKTFILAHTPTMYGSKGGPQPGPEPACSENFLVALTLVSQAGMSQLQK